MYSIRALIRALAMSFLNYISSFKFIAEGALIYVSSYRLMYSTYVSNVVNSSILIHCHYGK